jgi:hypothetical protein
LFENKGDVAVCIAPKATDSAGNALTFVNSPYCLYNKGDTLWTDRLSGRNTWYCITSSSSGTIGIMEMK